MLTKARKPLETLSKIFLHCFGIKRVFLSMRKASWPGLLWHSILIIICIRRLSAWSRMDWRFKYPRSASMMMKNCLLICCANTWTLIPSFWMETPYTCCEIKAKSGWGSSRPEISTRIMCCGWIRKMFSMLASLIPRDWQEFVRTILRWNSIKKSRSWRLAYNRLRQISVLCSTRLLCPAQNPQT